jgi:hypothetical protein
MTPERAKELLPIIQAFALGKVIEFRTANNSEWLVVKMPTWLDNCDYRIKPEKKKAWVNVYNWKMVPCSYDISSTKEQADNRASPSRIACIEIEYEEGQGL